MLLTFITKSLPFRWLFSTTASTFVLCSLLNTNTLVCFADLEPHSNEAELT